MRNNETLPLFLSFLKIGAFTFGGGYAMISLIQKEVVDNKKWLTEKDILDVVAIAETTPGPIAINAATFVGYKVNGIKGALVSTVGVVLPSFVIIELVATLFRKYMDYQIVQNAFWGVRISVLALIVKAFITMLKQCPKNVISYAVAALSLIAVAFFDINALLIIVAAAFLGISYMGIERSRKK